MSKTLALRKAVADSVDVGDEKLSVVFLVGTVVAVLSVSVLLGAIGGIATLSVIVFVVVLSMAIGDYRVGLIGSLILLPLGGTRIIPRELFGVTGLNPLNAVLAIVILSLVFLRLFQPEKVVLPRVSRYFGLYIAVISVAALYGAAHAGMIPSYFHSVRLVSFTGPGGYLRDILLKPMLILVTAFLLAVAVRNARDPRRFLVPLFVSALILPAYVLLYTAASGANLRMLASSTSRGFLSVTGMHANELGLMFNMGLALSLFTLFAMRAGMAKTALGALSVVLTLGVMLTFSRGAYLGLSVMLVYFLYTRRQFSSLALASLIILAIVVLVPPEVVERATTGAGSGNRDTLSAGRIDRIWLPLLPEVLENPVFGHGLSSILWSEANRRGFILRVGHPHSAYIGVMLDMGIVGFIAIAAFFVHAWRMFRRFMDDATDVVWHGFFQGGVVCILLLLVQGITDDRFTPTYSQPFLWLTYGVAMGLAGRKDVWADASPLSVHALSTPMRAR